MTLLVLHLLKMQETAMTSALLSLPFLFYIIVSSAGSFPLVTQSSLSLGYRLSANRVLIDDPVSCRAVAWSSHIVSLEFD